MPAAGDESFDARDVRGDERDRQADERDRRAEHRQCRADERDTDAVDLQDREALAVLLRAAGADREQAASDRAVAAADRKHSELDRLVAAHERGDAHEERAILQTDVLTGLMQRGAGLIALEREAARSARTGEAFVVVFIDVDGLKVTNDELGHASGDELLRTLGAALLGNMRSYDVALRYGGDEFVCILPGFGVAAAQERFAALQAALAAALLPVAVTFGIAEWRLGEETDELLARADAALYDMRRAGRGADDAETDAEASAVAAHGLLNSSAVVSVGIDTLHDSWDQISGEDREHILERMQVHSTSIDDRLREITRGR